MKSSSRRRLVSLAAALVVLSIVVFSSCSRAPQSGSNSGVGGGAGTAAEAQSFMADAEKRLFELNLKASRASWVQSNFITDDTEALAADANKDLIAATTELAEGARRFDGLQMPADLARKFKLLKLSLTLPAPKDAAERDELTKKAAFLEGAYGKGKWCDDKNDPKTCKTLAEAEPILATSRDPEELKKVWLGWHSVSPDYKDEYVRYVELANKGAKEMGFKDVGAMWRSNYDMSPEEFSAETERLWQQVKPLYDSLYVYTRTKLNEKYGDAVAPKDGPIPAHLLGNMWSQTWGNVYPLLAPPSGDPGYDLTSILRQRNTDAKGLVKYGENFFVSLGFDQLPQTFWERSLFLKPQDRDVVCHASAWDVDYQRDVRLKMCIQINDEDFSTVHHELGHNYYQMAYAPQPPLFQDSANDGFHEAIGDTIALSVTPEYFKQIGLIDRVPDANSDIPLLLHKALDKVAFLPFGYLVDQWRWKVFSGEVTPANYNQAWWDLRLKYQGIAPPAPRTENDFDAGAKYHVAANVPYARYFLAAILQFQFHRAMCKQAGYTGPLHRCSVYNNKDVGARLKQMLALGKSRPWPEALKALTGEDKMDATAIIDYFAPLKTWLDQQNAGRTREGGAAASAPNASASNANTSNANAAR
ncbi:MAG TPA: M2 family metallopeptidase [Pyrinomonadaceae bacterium]|jgi:peptidyl-dipeptidase A|nr:M2 family metallopeptidase [Pyrinomonadaceae bacterium]